MDMRERQRQYRQAVEANPAKTEKTRFADAFGVSNSAKVIERGLFAFNVNFDNLSPDADQIVVHCLLRFPPEDEIYFSLFIKSDIGIFRERLAEMRAAGGPRPRGGGREGDEEEIESETESSAGAGASGSLLPDNLKYTDNNKNVKGYLAKDGRLYTRNKGYWDSMPEDLSSVSKPVLIDQILFSIWPPAATARRSLLAREFVGYLGNLIGTAKLHELHVWEDAAAVSPGMRRMPPTVPIKEIEEAVNRLGGHYPDKQIERYHAALNYMAEKHFVILSGISGTGKTRLALQYARAVHGVASMKASDPFIFICPVRPEWTDPTGLTGYYDVLSNRYAVPQFLEAVLLATAHRDTPVFVLLDEMNLARIEYYFSDVLSAIETGDKLTLHTSGVPLEGSNGITVPAQVPIPSNLYITGTINIDETTNAVSDKVLDRAVVIDMSAVDLPGYLAKLEADEPDLADARKACESYLVAVQNILAPHGLGFGYRVADEVVRYHYFVAQYLRADTAGTNDDLMVQKILVKLRGAERQRPILNSLSRALDALPNSKKFIDRLLADLDEYGSFQAAR